MSNFLDYEIILQAVETKELYNDVQFCSFIKQPIEKNSSYCLIKINLTDVVVQQIKNDISSSNFPRFNLIIFLINNNKRSILLYEKVYKVLYLTTNDNDINIKQTVSCSLLLVNPILHYMSTTNAFNTIVNNTTSYDVIKKYQKFIVKNYGDGFYFNNIGLTAEKNEYLYEQILIKTQNDLVVPSEIIKKYKPFNSFNFYFFDDFNFSEDNTRDICVNYINLSNKKLFKKVDMYERTDIFQGLRKLKYTPVSDFFSIVHKNSETKNVITNEINYKTDKQIKSFIPTHKTIENKVISINEYNNISLTTNINLTLSNNRKKVNRSVEYTDLYAPDSIINSQTRFENAKNLFDNKITTIADFYCPNSIPNSIQLGNIYNFEKQNDFKYTPFNIVNIFFRKNIREPILSHVVKFNCFEFF